MKKSIAAITVMALASTAAHAQPFMTTSGEIGSEVNIDFSVPVPAGTDNLQTAWEPWVQATQDSPLLYSTTVTWTTPVDEASLSATVFAVNLSIDPRKWIIPTDTRPEAPSQLDNFNWTNNGDGVVGWSVTEEITVDDLLWEGVPFHQEGLDRFHIFTRGLPAEETWTISQTVTGGIVIVPEPSSIVLGLLGFVHLLRFRKPR